MSAIAVLFLGQLVTLLVLTATCYATGRLALRGVAFSSASEDLAVCATIGMGLAGTLLFLIGLCHGLTPAAIIACVLVVNLLALGIWKDVLERLRRSKWRPGAALPVIALIPSFILSLYPPHAFDETAYHLPFAKLFAEQHAVVFADTLRFPVFPQLAEMLFTAILGLAGDVQTHTVQWLAAFLVAIAMYGFTTRPTSLIATALWLGNPIVVFYAATSYVDLVLTLFCTMTWLAWVRFDATDDRRWLVISGLSAAFAAGAKYLGLYFVVVLLVMIAVRSSLRRIEVRSAAVAVSIAIAAASPWYLRNAVETGNPVFPYLTPIFGTSPWKTRFDRAAGPEGAPVAQLGRGAAMLIPTPMEIITLPSRTIGDRRYLRGEPPLSPFVSSLIALAVVGAIRTRSLRAWSLPLALYALLVARGDVRYLLPIAPFLCVAEAEGLMSLRRLERRWAIVLVTMVFVAPGLAYATWKVASGGPIPATRSQRDDFLSRAIPAYRALQSLNQSAGPRYVVYGATAPNARYFADGRYLGEITGPASFALVAGETRTAREIAGALLSLGADRLIVDSSVVPGPVVLRIRRSRAFRLQQRYDDIELYALMPP